jgi:hypothetical protein
MSNNAKMSVERVCLYANGTCEIVGKVFLTNAESTKVELVIPEANANSVLSSLTVSGQGARVISPPTVKLPESPKGQLVANGSDPYQLIEQLAGADVKIVTIVSTYVEGTLVGVVKKAVGNASAPAEIMIRSKGRLSTLSLDAIKAIEFVDGDVQKRIDAALERSIQKIRPTSAVISFDVAGDEGTSVAVSYVLATSPWVMSYVIEQGDSGLSLQAFAHVYNTTEEDWQNAAIVASTASPQDFIPLMRQPKIPARKQVSFGDTELDGPAETSKSGRAPVMAQFATARSTGAESLGSQYDEGNSSFADGSAFDVQTSTTKYEGTVEYAADSAVTVPAGSNSNVNVLNTILDGAKRVAYFDARNGGTKVLAALSGSNGTGTLLTRGAGVVYADGRFLGRCIVPELTEGEEFFIPYGKESRIAVSPLKVTKNERRYSRIQIGEGVIKTETFNKVEFEFDVRNNSAEEFTMVVDIAHYCASGNQHSIKTSTGSLVATQNGSRLVLNLGANDSLLIVVKESEVLPSQVIISQNHSYAHRFVDGLLVAGAELENAPEMKAYVHLCNEITLTERAVAMLTSNRDNIAKEMELLRQNLDSLSKVAGHSEQVTAWGSELVEATKAHKQANAAVSARTEKLNGLKNDLKTALEAVTLVWIREQGF